MNFIIFDLEFNQNYKSGRENKNVIASRCPFEIIQIGAVKLNERLEILTSLDRLIRPEIYTDIHPFVKEMTNITIDLLNTAKSFNEIYKEFIQFVKDGRSVLCVWGMTDMRELFRNIKYHELDPFLVPKEYINLQLHTSKYFNSAKGTNIGLHRAVELLNIPINDQFHDAFNDACYTAEVFKRIYNENIRPTIYNADKYIMLNRHHGEKKKLDTNKLINQFEKMFNREMTIEEQSIIKLAYIMGKTNQFQTEISNNPNTTKDKK